MRLIRSGCQEPEPGTDDHPATHRNGTPLVLAVNMVDEARSRGIEIQHSILEEILGVKALPTVATRKKGLDQILPNLLRAKKAPIVSSTRPLLKKRLNSCCR